MLDQVFGPGGLGLTSGSSSKSNIESTGTPFNLQNPAYQNLAPGVASGLTGLFGGQPSGGIDPILSMIFGAPSGGGSYSLTGNPGTGTGQNPLVAGLTPQQIGLINQAGGQAQLTPNQMAANASNKTMLDPSWLNTAANPNVQAAVTAATNPIVQAFNTTTAPGMTAAATGAGQNAGNAPNARTPGGSSAFDRAFSNAQTGMGQAIGQTTSAIELPAYEQAVTQQQTAAAQANQFSTQQLQNTIQALSASALPQILKQYGIQQGLQVFQQRIQNMLQALGLGGQISQPVASNITQSQGSSSGSSSQGLLSAIGGGGGAAALGGL